MFFKLYRDLQMENKKLKEENETLRAQLDKRTARVIKQWEHFFDYDGSPQGGSLDED